MQAVYASEVSELTQLKDVNPGLSLSLSLSLSLFLPLSIYATSYFNLIQGDLCSPGWHFVVGVTSTSQKHPERNSMSELFEETARPAGGTEVRTQSFGLSMECQLLDADSRGQRT